MVQKIGVVGLGTVGGEVARRLQDRSGTLTTRTGTTVELSAVAEPAVPESFEHRLEGLDLYEDAEELIDQAEVDILVGLIGGLNPAGRIVERALKSGMDVVTANKELLAHDGEKLFKTARETGQRIRFEAAVGGCIPVVRSIREAMVDADFEAIYGIINGTSNYVLTRMEHDGLQFEEALQLAQEKGYAEADPSYDVEGTDTAHKIALLAGLGFGTRVTLDEIYCRGIRRIQPEIMRDAEQFGYKIKLLGLTKQTDRGLDTRVHPTLIPEDSALAAIQYEYNAVLTQGTPVGRNMLTGKGAGGGPTATAVIGDIISLARNSNQTRAPYYYGGTEHRTVPIEEVESRFYLRLMAQDEPGVLSKVTTILSNHDISIDSVIQRGRSEDNLVPVVLTTHEASQGSMDSAVGTIADLDVIGEDPVSLHIEEDFEK
ncbi:MAG: homoserine dehydrogenase [bacterium]